MSAPPRAGDFTAPHSPPRSTLRNHQSLRCDRISPPPPSSSQTTVLHTDAPSFGLSALLDRTVLCSARRCSESTKTSLRSHRHPHPKAKCSLMGLSHQNQGTACSPHHGPPFPSPPSTSWCRCSSPSTLRAGIWGMALTQHPRHRDAALCVISVCHARRWTRELCRCVGPPGLGT